MSHFTDHHIVFTKDSQRMLNEKAMTNNTTHILGVNSKTLRARGWRISASPINWVHSILLDDSVNEYRYELHFTATHAGDTAPGKSELRAIVKTMNTRATNPLGGRWSIATVDGQPYEVTRDGDAVSTKDFIAY